MGQRDKLKPVIYCIFNKVNEKRYIGSATRGRERWRSHRQLLRNKIHFSSHLQNAWNKYGEENFEFQIVEYIPFENLTTEEIVRQLNQREEYWIQEYKSNDRTNGYNTRIECDTNLGLKWPEESRKRFSENKKGKPIPHLKGIAEKLWKDPNFRENRDKKMKEWWSSLSQEDKQKIYDKKNKTLQVTYAKNLELYGTKRDPETIKKVQTSFIENGHSLILHTYFPNGTFFKTFQTAADALRFLGEKPKNTASIINRLDKNIFRGLIFSYTKYDKYPVENLEVDFLVESVVTNKETGEKYLCKTFKEVHEEFCVPRGRLYLKFFINNVYEYGKYKIEIIAPVIGDNNSEAGEFIENLYRSKDNNELSGELTSTESAETNGWNCNAEYNTDTSARQLNELKI